MPPRVPNPAGAIRISRLKFAKFSEYFKNKAEAEILKRIDIILCAKCFF